MGRNAFGQPMLRKEDARLLIGAGRFTADLLRPETVHAVVLRSPHAHARITAIDTEAARAMPGVLAVLTGADYRAAGLGGIPAGTELAKLPGTGAASAYQFRPKHHVLAEKTVRYVGDSVALVVAESLAQARDAAEMVMVDYSPESAVTGTAEAQGGAAVWPQAPDNVCFRWQAGDAPAVTAAFAAADRVVRLDTVNPRIHVGALETRGAIGEYDVATGKYTLATGSQMPHDLKHALAEHVLHVPPEQIRVTIADVGGSFGIKNALYPEQILVLWAAKQLGRPVAWIGDRSDGFLSDYQARDNVYAAEIALDAEARFLALRVTSTAAVGAYLAPQGQLSPTSNTPALAGVYRFPAIEVSVTGVFSNTAPTEVYRGAGRPEAVYLLERTVDHVAREIGMDRMELRRRNMLRPEELPFQTALGLRYDSGDFPAMFETALQRADYAAFPARKAASEARGRRRGIGLAHYCERVAGSWGEHGWLEMGHDGQVRLMVSTMSNGQGHATAYAQLVADRLGIEPEDVEVIQGDTDRTPFGHGTGGSASLPIAGAALAVASTELIQKALPLAAEALEAAPADVVFEDGKFRIVGTDRAVGLGAAAARLAQGAMLEADGFWKPDGPTFPNGCHVAEVEVDPETGAWTIERYTMLHDFGQVLNPMLLQGQLQGGVTQGIGQAAHEHVVHDAESGQLLTGSLMDYQLPRADEIPPLLLETLPTAAPANPLGVKGCGEAGAAGGAPAVMNALADALADGLTGGRPIDMPATAERVWRALRG